MGVSPPVRTVLLYTSLAVLPKRIKEEENMKLTKKALAAALVLLAALSFAACSKSQGQAGGAAGSPAVREIVFWDMMWGPAATYPDVVKTVVERFNSSNQDNIHVTPQMIPWDNFYQVFLTAVTSKAAPDVSTGAFMQSIQYAEMGEGLSLDPIVDKWRAENNPILNDYSEAMFNLHMYDGHHYGLPWNLDTREFLYRKDFFEQAGITAMPRTWAEFEQVCARLKASLPQDISPVVFPGGGDYNGLQAIMTFMFQNDVGPTDVNGQPDYLNPKITEVLQFINRLYVNGYIPEGLPAYKGVDAEKLYQAGKAAMYHHAPLDLADFPDIDANSGVMPPMAGPSGTARNYTWVNAIGAFSQTKDPDASLIFVKWWLENQKDLWIQGGMGSLPARTSFRADPYFASQWQKKQIDDLILPTATTPVYPCPSIYLPFSVIEGEAIPMEGLVRACARNPNYQTIQREVQDKMLAAWAEFDM
jgi:multiple sugar transport system substrate-binding protein